MRELGITPGQAGLMKERERGLLGDLSAEGLGSDQPRYVQPAPKPGLLGRAKSALWPGQPSQVPPYDPNAPRPPVTVTSPVPGVVGSSITGRGPGFEPSRKPLSATERAATKRAGGLVFEGAPIATDHARPARKGRGAAAPPAGHTPKPTDNGATHIRRLEAQKDEFAKKWGADDKGVAAIQKRIDKVRSTRDAKMGTTARMDFQRAATAAITAYKGGSAKSSKDPDVGRRAHAGAEQTIWRKAGELMARIESDADMSEEAKGTAITKIQSEAVAHAGRLGKAPELPAGSMSAKGSAKMRELLKANAVTDVATWEAKRGNILRQYFEWALAEGPQEMVDARVARTWLTRSLGQVISDLEADFEGVGESVDAIKKKVEAE